MGRRFSLGWVGIGSLLVVCLLISGRVYGQYGAGSLRGTVTDPSGAAIVGASVIATSTTGVPSTATTNTQGAYELRGLPPGTYEIKVSARGFEDFDRQGISISEGQTTSFDAELSIEIEQQHVQVSDTSPTLEVSPDKNAGAINLKGSDLDALSDDPDQMQQDLQALAGPATGPNGGQMYVNGFTAGQLPPKSSIREIKVNQNPFSAEYDSVGFGRIEILTKPGTDQLHGSGFIWSNDQAFNSWSPFVQPSSRLPYYMVLYEGDLSGSLSKKTSFSFTLSHRGINQLSLGALQDPDTFQVTPGALSVANPRSRISGGGSIDYQITPNNTLTLRYQYWGNNEKGDGISIYTLPSQAYNSITNEHQVQVADTQIFHDTIVNETRFQYLRDYTANAPVSAVYAASAPGYVNAGGNTAGASTDIQNHYEFQNYTTVVKGKQTLMFGARLRDENDWNSSLATANGSFTFASSDAYIAAETALAQSQAVPPADYPIAFTLGVGSPIASVNLFDAGLFVQDDWQLKPNFTLSMGLRFETQTGIPDHADYAPRAAIAYGIGKTKAGAPRSVLRGGWGIFYDRFPESNLLNAIRFNGATQVTYDVLNPAFFPTIPTAAELSGYASLPTKDTISPSLHAPYTMQAAATLEQQLFHGTTLTLNYINARGVHEIYTANINTPLPGTFDPANPQAATYPFGYNAGYIDQFQSGGIFKQNQFIVNFNGTIRKHLNLFSYYVLNSAHGTTNGLLSDYYDPSLDYGRTTFDVRNRIFVGGSLTLPYGFEATMFEVYSSGQPYNITSGQNLYGTSGTAQNARPSFTALPPDPPTSADPTHVETVFASPWGNLYNGLPPAGSGESVIPINLATGTSQSYVNLGVAKTFTFGPKAETPSTSGASSPASTSASGKPSGRYSLTFTIYARNAFNQVSYGTRVGVLNSPPPPNFQSDFLQPVSLAVPVAANRMVYLYARFSF
ncbi:MAG TPA: carboxypeptidase regulatory-like domain-containing protein [Candidatus Aquilonibacter sp.]|nr:carboxypeptidase regulatory-like domain-containing protein [Candidatus Aquilonibacter sp.]